MYPTARNGRRAIETGDAKTEDGENEREGEKEKEKESRVTTVMRRDVLYCARAAREPRASRTPSQSPFMRRQRLRVKERERERGREKRENGLVSSLSPARD
jgi:hypothetical protein